VEDHVQVIPGQLTIYHEMALSFPELAPNQREYLAGVLSHYGRCDDDALVRAGRLFRRHAERAKVGHKQRECVFYSALLGAATDEWLRRQDVKRMVGDDPCQVAAGHSPHSATPTSQTRSSRSS
jgi:hypothetical protein